jgi:hypothetical protein
VTERPLLRARPDAPRHGGDPVRPTPEEGSREAGRGRGPDRHDGRVQPARHRRGRVRQLLVRGSTRADGRPAAPLPERSAAAVVWSLRPLVRAQRLQRRLLLGRGPERRRDRRPPRLALPPDRLRRPRGVRDPARVHARQALPGPGWQSRVPLGEQLLQAGDHRAAVDDVHHAVPRPGRAGGLARRRPVRRLVAPSLSEQAVRRAQRRGRSVFAAGAMYFDGPQSPATARMLSNLWVHLRRR